MSETLSQKKRNLFDRSTIYIGEILNRYGYYLDEQGGVARGANIVTKSGQLLRIYATLNNEEEKIIDTCNVAFMNYTWVLLPQEKVLQTFVGVPGDSMQRAATFGEPRQWRITEEDTAEKLQDAHFRLIGVIQQAMENRLSVRIPLPRGLIDRDFIEED